MEWGEAACALAGLDVVGLWAEDGYFCAGGGGWVVAVGAD